MLTWSSRLCLDVRLVSDPERDLALGSTGSCLTRVLDSRPIGERESRLLSFLSRLFTSGERLDERDSFESNSFRRSSLLDSTRLSLSS